MKELPKTFLIFTFIFTFCAIRSCDCEAGITRVDVALWLARSCVGEAGFDSASTGECAAILHVYKKRSRLTKFSVYKVVRKYSAAVKRGPHQKRRWVFHLRRDGKKPKHWNDKLSWKNHRPKWEEVLKLCDDFLTGKVADPLPLADHYGGKMDRHRALRWRWFRLLTPEYNNYFWSVTDPKKKRKMK